MNFMKKMPEYFIFFNIMKINFFLTFYDQHYIILILIIKSIKSVEKRFSLKGFRFRKGFRTTERRKYKGILL